MIHDLVLFAHVVGACVLVGTGAGIAFFMVISATSRDPALVAHVAGIVVLADFVFTATAVLLQPLTGYVLTRLAGWSLGEGWVLLSMGLYAAVGALWLPVVWMQMRLRALAVTARDAGRPLPPAWWRLFRIWFALGVPAFAAVLAILWLMLTRPAF